MKSKKNKFNIKILNSLLCPASGGNLKYDSKKKELISIKGKLAYPIKNGNPILLIEKARKL